MSIFILFIYYFNCFDFFFLLLYGLSIKLFTSSIVTLWKAKSRWDQVPCYHDSSSLSINLIRYNNDTSYFCVLLSFLLIETIGTSHLIRTNHDCNKFTLSIQCYFPLVFSNEYSIKMHEKIKLYIFKPVTFWDGYAH